MPAPEESTFYDFAREWFDARWKTWAPNTRKDYEWRLEHLRPLYPLPLSAVATVATVDGYRDAKLADDECKLGNESINKTLTLLGSILDTAQERDLIARNPLRINPKNRRLPTRKLKGRWLDTAEKIAAIIDAAGELDREARGDRGRYRRPIIATLVLAGPRISEADALRWRDVDLAGGTLNIDRAKTEAGERTVNLLPMLRDELVAHRAVSMFAGPNDPVFATNTGKRIGKDNLRNRVFAKAVERANANLERDGRQPLPLGLTPHDLRRTFVSVLFALGEVLPYVMDQVGHADSRMTTGIYMKVMRRDPVQKAAVRALVDGGVWDPMGREAVSGASNTPPFDRPQDAENPAGAGLSEDGRGGFEPATSRV